MRKVSVMEIQQPGLTIPQAARFCGYSPEYFGKIYDKPAPKGLDLIKHVQVYKLPGHQGYRLDLADLRSWYESHKVN